MPRYSRRRSSRRRFAPRLRRKFRSRALNKRRFKKSLTQNAFYFKSKIATVISSPSTSLRTIVGINANGDELNTGPYPPMMYQLSAATGTGTGIACTDIPSQMTEVYSQMRLAGVKLKWLPGLPNGAIAGTAYSPMCLVYDRDGIEGNSQTATLTSLLQNTNGTYTKNMYMPWSKYIKFPKYKLNTRIPSIPSQGTNIQANENLAGQWKNLQSSLADASWGVTTRGTHVLLHVSRPANITGDVPLGTLVTTFYFVYKDRV